MGWMPSIPLSPRIKKLLWWTLWIIVGVVVIVGLGICCWLGYKWTRQRLNRISKDLSMEDSIEENNKGGLIPSPNGDKKGQDPQNKDDPPEEQKLRDRNYKKRKQEDESRSFSPPYYNNDRGRGRRRGDLTKKRVRFAPHVRIMDHVHQSPRHNTPNNNKNDDDNGRQFKIYPSMPGILPN